MWYDSIPYGVLLLTSLYVAFVSFVYTYSPECLDRYEEPCLSAGGRIDDSTIAWATAFYASFSILLLALHLVYMRLYKGSFIRLSGIWAQVFMAIGLALQGVARIFYGGDQGHQGATEFFLLWSASFFYMTLSCLLHGKVVRLAIKQNDAGGGSEGCCCWGSKCALWMATTVVFWAAITILGGSIKCALPFDDSSEEISVTNSTNATDNIFDNAGLGANQTNITIVAPGLFDKEDRTMCENVVFYGEIGWYGAYAWFWIAAGALCRRAIRGKEQSKEMVQGYPISVLGLGLRLVLSSFRWSNRRWSCIPFGY
jgi:hypothetical protein